MFRLTIDGFRKIFGRLGSFIVCATLVSFFFASSVSGETPQGNEGKSPIESLQEAISAIKSQGKDVAALQTELDQLKPDWKKIQEKQAEILPMVEVFRPRVEALMKKVQAAGGGGVESPIVGLQKGIDQLKARGKDVAALQTELDGLKPDWEAIMKKQSDLKGTSSETEKQDIEKLVKAFQPRVEGLMHNLKTLAATLEKEGATKSH